MSVVQAYISTPLLIQQTHHFPTFLNLLIKNPIELHSSVILKRCTILHLTLSPQPHSHCASVNPHPDSPGFPNRNAGSTGSSSIG